MEAKPLFEPYPACVQCLLGLARNSMTVASQENPALLKRAEKEAVRILEQCSGKGWTSPEIANLILLEVQRLSRVFDPYRYGKALEMKEAKTAFERVESYVGPDLHSRVLVAALGNTLDFFRRPEEAFSRVVRQTGRRPLFFRDETNRLDEALGRGVKLILYLTDNAGEIYFDLPLWKYLVEKVERMVLVVKGGPALNDLTRTELRGAGLEHHFAEVADTGTPGAGIDWKRTSTEFRRLVREADVIVSKGMANFETVFPRDLEASCFFLFQAKCEPIQKYLGTPPDAFIAAWKDGRTQDGR